MDDEPDLSGHGIIQRSGIAPKTGMPQRDPPWMASV